MPKVKEYPPLGSVSTGTMRTEDLIPDFLTVLAEYAPKRAREIRKDKDNRAIFKWLDGEQEEPDESDDLLNELFDELNVVAAPYTYFGAHEGDGADYGFWVSYDVLEEDAQSGEGIIKVNAGDPWPADLSGISYVMKVTDHGNITLYDAASHAEIWSTV